MGQPDGPPNRALHGAGLLDRWSAVPPLGAGGAQFAPGHSRTLVYWKSAAVDRRVIPFGSKIFMRALCSTPAHGWVVARDTGGAIGGAHIDIYRPPPAQLSGGAVLRRQAMLVVPPGTRHGQRGIRRCRAGGGTTSIAWPRRTAPPLSCAGGGR